MNFSTTYKGGSEQVALSFIHECRNFTENEFYIILRKNLEDQINKNEFPENFKFYLIKNRPVTGFWSFFKARKIFKKLENQIEPDCIISTGGHTYWNSSLPSIAGFNIPHYIYPESPYFGFLSFHKRLFFNFKKKIDYYFWNRADALVVQTEDIKERLEKQFPKKPVYHVYNTVNNHFLNPVHQSEKLPAKQPAEIRLLTLSSYYPHKNLEVIREVIEELINQHIYRVKFVLTLPEDVFLRVFGTKHWAYIFNVGPVPAKECPGLYKEVDFMFLPTLLECFSASYAEAMMMNKPILTSDLGFAHTVCKDAAVYFDPLNAQDITKKIVNLSQDKSKQYKLISRGQEIVKEFNTPEERARKYLDICKEVSGN